MGSAYEKLTKIQAEAWDSAPFENVADNAADIHENLLGRLEVNPGERWLDIATGTGAVALRAARLGADVTAQDFAPRLIATARRLAKAEGLAMTFDVGDCQKLPYPDESFDVASSVLVTLYLRLIITLLPTNLDAFVGQEDASAWQAGAQAAKLKRITESQLVSVHHLLRVSVHHLPGADPPM